MPHSLVTILGKSVRYVARLRGGGSALPGLFVEKISPNFIKNCLSGLEHGVVIISGTNGKTTTTKIVVELLEASGLKVFTNRTGSNFTRGIAAALLGEIDSRGKLHADIAVLELDEAHAVKFIDLVQPRYSLLLNVMRDQLDRFGEIDSTAKMLEKIAVKTTDVVVLNREDPRILAISGSVERSTRTELFGLSDELRDIYRSDDDMYSTRVSTAKRPPASVVLESVNGTKASFSIEGSIESTSLQLNGLYNIYNSAAALALVKTILGQDASTKKLVSALKNVKPAFGRGESIIVGGQPLEIVLVKNPSGFRLGLQSFDPEGVATMIAINDNYADGRDMSWLWDVSFDSLSAGVDVVSGIRAYDMALRLQYNDIHVQSISPSLPRALRRLLSDHPGQPKRVYCTYTAMLTLRRELSKITTVEVVS
jgi:UDP-N-acetylmuramyl tripeptide synthase